MPSHITSLLQVPEGRRLIVWTPVLAFLLAAIPFATVHPSWRIAVGVSTSLLCSWVLLAHRRRVPPASTLAAPLLALLALLSSTLALLPLDSAGRALLQPGLTVALETSLEVSGDLVHPLAVDPRNALRALAFAPSMILLGLATHFAVRRSRDAEKLLLGLVAAGCLLALTAWLHRFTRAESIWWISNVPNPLLVPFVAPFVSPNHAGAAFAALVPLCLGLGLASQRLRSLAWIAGLLLLAAIWFTQSRGAILEALLGLSVFALLGRKSWPRIVALASYACAGGLFLAIGAERLTMLWTRLVNPDEGVSLTMGGRLEMYRETLELIRGAPLLGAGVGSFAAAYPIMKENPTFSFAAHAHQEYLQAFAELGTPVAILFLLSLGIVLWRGVRRALEPYEGEEYLLKGLLGAATSLLISAAIDFPIRCGALAALSVIICGAILALSTRREAPAAGLRGSVFLGMGGLLALLPLPFLVLLGLTRGATPSVWGNPAAAETRAMALLGGQGANASADRAREAADWLRIAIHQEPTRALALVQLARIENVLQRPELARRALEAATAIHPSLPRPHLDLARHDLAQGDRELALLDYGRLLRLDAPDTRTGASWTREAAEIALTEEDFILLLPPRVDRWREAGLLVHAGGRAELGEALLLEAIRMEPTSTSPESAVALASLLLRQKRSEDALRVLEPLPKSCSVSTVRAKAALQLEAWADARVQFGEALSLCSSSDRSLRRGMAQARLGTPDEAQRGIDILEKLLAEDPDDHASRRLLLAHYRARGRKKELIAQLRLLVRQGGATPRESAELGSLENELLFPAGAP